MKTEINIFEPIGASSNKHPTTCNHANNSFTNIKYVYQNMVAFGDQSSAQHSISDDDEITNNKVCSVNFIRNKMVFG